AVIRTPVQHTSLPATASTATMAPYFFFQAEDGIRDFHVTGVQTCALPICLLIDFLDTAFVGARPLLRLLDRAAERVDFGVHFADLRVDEAFRCTGGRATERNRHDRYCQHYPSHVSPPES